MDFPTTSTNRQNAVTAMLTQELRTCEAHHYQNFIDVAIFMLLLNQLSLISLRSGLLLNNGKSCVMKKFLQQTGNGN